MKKINLTHLSVLKKLSTLTIGLFISSITVSSAFAIEPVAVEPMNNTLMIDEAKADIALLLTAQIQSMPIKSKPEVLSIEEDESLATSYPVTLANISVNTEY